MNKWPIPDEGCIQEMHNRYAIDVATLENARLAQQMERPEVPANPVVHRDDLAFLEAAYADLDASYERLKASMELRTWLLLACVVINTVTLLWR